MNKIKLIFSKEAAINKFLLYTAFSIYLFLLIWIIALKFNAEWLPEIGRYFRKMPLMERVGKKIIPFYDMYEKGIYFNKDYFWNVIIYMPLGIYLLIILKNRHKCLTSIIIIILSSFIFEFIQLVTGFGGCDGSDLVCNTLGGVVGLILYLLLIKKFPSRVINIINLLAIIFFLPLGIHAFINTIMNLHLYKI